MLRRYYGKISFLPIENFVGKDGELVIDDVTSRVYVMDGNTAGGIELGIGQGANLGNLTVNSQTISGTITNGNIHINPNGTGNLVVGGNIYMGVGDFRIRKRLFTDAEVINEPTVILASDTSSLTIKSANTFNYLHFDRTTGNIGVNSELPAYRFDIHGTARVTDNFVANRIYANTVFAQGSSPINGQGFHFGTTSQELGAIKYLLTEGKIKLINQGNVALEIVQEGHVNFTGDIQGNIIPVYNNAYTLGNVSNQWKELLVGNITTTNGVYWSNGTAIVSSAYGNTNVTAFYNAANTFAVGSSNVNIQSNSTALFVGNLTAIYNNGYLGTATEITNNMYRDASGSLRYRRSSGGTWVGLTSGSFYIGGTASGTADSTYSIGYNFGVTPTYIYAYKPLYIPIGSNIEVQSALGITATNTVLSGNVRTVGNLLTDSNLTVTGNISANNATLSGNLIANVSGFAIGYRDIPQVVFAANASISATDAGKHYYSTSSSDLTLTVPNNAVVSWTVGTAITLVNRGTANMTITPASGVSLYLAGNNTSASRTLTTYGMASLLNVAANVWMINGTGLV